MVVAGAGVATAPAARLLLAHGARVIVVDARETAAEPQLRSAGAQITRVLEGPPPDTALVVVSPGFRPGTPLLVAAARIGIPVWGEVEFAWRLRGPGAAPWLAVTGTNGKTTTVTMLAAILRAGGAKARAVGNVGVSVIDAVTSGDDDVLAVELSSFQLFWSASVRPAAGALLNLAPDHLDWHGSMGAYVGAKLKIWQGCAGATAVGGLDDPQVAGLLGRQLPTGVRPVGFTLAPPLPGQLGLADGVLVDRAFPAGSAESEPLLPATDVRPAGPHNLRNALAAAALARSYGSTAAAVAAGLRGYQPEPHRNAEVGTGRAVRWVDDSKATNPHAAAASLAAYSAVVWIAGGQLKGAPVDDLVAQVAPRLVGVVLLGEDRARIRAALARHAPDVPVIEVASTDDGAMIEVVAAARSLARPGTTVVLAPAAASYDMFSSYAARGDAFVAALRAAGALDA